MTEYKRTSLNFIEKKEAHSDAAFFLSLVGKLKTEVVVKLVINYLDSCGIDDVSKLDRRIAKKMANELITPSKNTRMTNLLQELKNDLYSAISSGHDVAQQGNTDFNNKIGSNITSKSLVSDNVLPYDKISEDINQLLENNEYSEDDEDTDDIDSNALAAINSFSV